MLCVLRAHARVQVDDALVPNHTLQSEFSIMAWMKHTPDRDELEQHKKEHILCNSDGQGMCSCSWCWRLHVGTCYCRFVLMMFLMCRRTYTLCIVCTRVLHAIPVQIRLLIVYSFLG